MLEAEPERRTAIVHLSDDQIVAAVRHVVPGAQLIGHRLTTTGLANTNYVIETARDIYVLRIHARDDALAAKERALYQLVKTSVPVARLLGTGDATVGLGHTFSLLEFVPGETLEAAVAKANSHQLLAVARSLGRVLARLTTFHFATCGDLVAGVADGELAVSPWERMDFFQRCLFESPAGNRLGPLRDRLWAFLQHAHDASDPLPIHLAHGDFNPTNLLIRADGEVAALLDWEFAHSGKLWSDVGNLLRHRAEAPLPAEFAEELARGLADGGVPLPQNWKQRSEVEDLSSACEFLSSEQGRPVVHARAHAQIARTLGRWAP